MRRRTHVRGLVLAALAVALAAAPAAGADGSLGIAVVDQPRTDDPRSQRYIVAEVEPGDRVRRTVEVTSAGEQPTEVTLYAGAAAVDRSGFVFADGAATNELTAWTRISPADLLLEPGAARRVVVTVDVPETAPPGERHAVVWAQVTTGVGPESVRLVSRVGVRMHITVSERGSGALPLPLVLAAAALVGSAGVLAARAARQNRR